MMLIKDLIAELVDWLERNQEPELPDVEINPEVMVEDEYGTFRSPIMSAEDANGPVLIVYPYEYECTCGQTKDDHDPND